MENVIFNGFSTDSIQVLRLFLPISFRIQFEISQSTHLMYCIYLFQCVIVHDIHRLLNLMIISQLQVVYEDDPNRQCACSIPRSDSMRYPIRLKIKMKSTDGQHRISHLFYRIDRKKRCFNEKNRLITTDFTVFCSVSDRFDLNCSDRLDLDVFFCCQNFERKTNRRSSLSDR